MIDFFLNIELYRFVFCQDIFQTTEPQVLRTAVVLVVSDDFRQEMKLSGPRCPPEDKRIGKASGAAGMGI